MGSIISENAIWNYPEPLKGTVDTSGFVAFYWDKMDSWFEEDEEVFVHARNPYKRVESLRSSRHLEIVLNGQLIAETRNSVMLLETGMPYRFYIPEMDVFREFLRPSLLTTRCPYKGEARYYSVEVGGKLYQDLGWYYPYPTLEVAKISNLICFPQGKVGLYVDGVLEDRPNTRWD